MLPIASVAQTSSTNQSIQLTELMGSFFSEDTDFDEAWNGCDKCRSGGTGGRSPKRVGRISRLPIVLTIAVGRFASMQRKIDVHVDVDLDGELDMSPYLIKQMPKTERCRYRLFAMACHSGSLHNGHYWAMVRSHNDTKQWVRIDDAMCVQEDTREPSKVPQEAYMFFFVQSS
jgi:ubiquitin C-terminal hydrolase